MKTESSALLADLRKRTETNILAVKSYATLPMQTLNHKPAPDAWSMLECFEHLNLYGNYYLPELERAIRQAQGKPFSRAFVSGWLGNYFAESMLPKKGQIKPMKTFSDKNPAGSQLSIEVLFRFLAQQERMLQILHNAQQIDLTRTKTGVSFTRWIKIRLGDTLRFVVYHNERHLAQAQRVLQTQSVQKGKVLL